MPINKNHKIVIILPDFFSNRVAALARYVLELLKRNRHNQITLITTNSVIAPESQLGFSNIIFLEKKGWHFYARAMEQISAFDLILFYGGYSGSIPFMYYSRRLRIPKVLNIFTPHFRWRDLTYLKPSDLIYAFKRIFLHSYFASLLFPTYLFRRLFFQNGRVELVVPSRRLKTYYDNLLRKAVCRFIPPGGDPDSFNKSSNVKISPDKEKIIILHSGLASILRGLDDLIVAYSELPGELKRRTKLILAIYLNTGERIHSFERIQGLLRRHLSCDNYELILNPLSDIHPIFEKADICVFPYRYPGDIPEVPLTAIELLYKKKAVISNRIGCLEEWIDEKMLLKPGNIFGLRDLLAATISKLLTGNSPPVTHRLRSWDDYCSRYQEILTSSQNMVLARKFFDRESETYEERVLKGSPGITHISQLEQEIIKRVLMNCPPGRYLDIGVGTGRFIPMLKSRGCRIVGADISLKMLKIHKGKIKLSAGTASALPFREEVFDGILSMRTMKYVATLETALEDFYRVLRPGGLAIIQFANKITYQYFLKHLSKLGDQEYNQILQLYSFKQLERSICQTKFKILSVENTIRIPFFIYAKYFGPRTFKWFRTVEYGLDKLIPGNFLSRDFVFILRK